MNKTVKIQLDPNYDFQLIAIVSSEPIYRLSWLINEQFGTLLTESGVHQVYHQKANLEQPFVKYSYLNPAEVSYNLIQNKSENGLLIDEQKQVDFWLTIEHGLQKTTEVLSKLKKIKNISLAFEVIPGSLKSKSRLIITQDPN